MRVLASADETGNIKEVVCAAGTDTSKKDGQRPESVDNILEKDDLTTVKHRISHLKTISGKWLAALRLGGIVSVYDMENSEEKYKPLHTYRLDVDATDKPVALLIFEEHEFMMAAFESSKVFVISFHGGFDNKPFAFSLPPRQKKKPATVDAFVANPYAPGIFAYGGKENDLQVVRLFDKKVTSAKQFASEESWSVKVLFKADNVAPDHLDLKVPIWITNILFMDPPEKGNKLVTSTRYGHIRKYNTAEDQEPVDSYKVCEKPIVNLVFATQDQTEIIICDTHTYVARYSLVQVDKKAHRIVSASAGTFFKPSLKLLGKYSEGGNTGAIHGIAISPADGVVIFGGLDRYLRSFEIQSRKLISKVYLGVQISSVKAIEFVEAPEEVEEVNEEEENEEFWKDLDEKKTDVPLIKRRKRVI